MRIAIALIVLNVFCYNSDPIKIKIVSKKEAEKYLAFSDGFVRLMTKGKIKDNRGCSKFLIDSKKTTVSQMNKYLCKSPTDPGIVICSKKNDNSTWEIIPGPDGDFVTLRLDGTYKCLHNNGPESADNLGNYLNARNCDPASDAQKFKIKRVVSRKNKI